MLSAFSSMMATDEAAANRPSLPQHIEAYGDQIRDLKNSLKASGQSNKAIKENPQVAGMVARLDQMKSQAGIDPKTNLPFNVPVPKQEKAPKAVQNSRELPSDLQGMGMQLRDLKESLKARGLTNNQIKQNPQVAGLTQELNSRMQDRVPQKPKPGTSWAASWFTGSSTAPKKSPEVLSPQAQALKNQLQGVKKDLKAHGVKGPQLIQNPQVRTLQSQLDQMRQGRNPTPVMNQFPTQVSFVGSDARQQAMAAATSGRFPQTSSFAPQTSSFASPMQRPSGYGSLPTTTSFSGYGVQGTAVPYSASFRR